MTTSKTIPANPIQHLEYDSTYKKYYSQITNKIKEKSWEVHLIKWAETGGTISKICRWAIIVFSGAIAVAALHDKIKDVESHNAKKGVITATYNDYKTTQNSVNYSTKNEINTINFIKKYTEAGGKPVSPEVSRPKISDARAVSWHAALYTQDFRDLLPKAKDYIEKTCNTTDLEIEECLNAFKATVQADDQGHEFLTCSKKFGVWDNETLIGYVTIARNFNPHAEDTVSFTYEPYESGEDLE